MATTVPPDQRLKFFVFVVESPSAADLYHRRSEGEIVRQAVELNGIACVVKTAISLEAFDACLKLSLAAAMKTLPGFIPLLHISAHGDLFGIQLSDGHTMPWSRLREHLRPVNEALGGALVVCMSSCQGYGGIQMAMDDSAEAKLPYYALIGCGTEPTWGETAVAFATLYHQLSRGVHINAAVEAMRVASGNDRFFFEHAETTRQSYLQMLSKVNAERARENLEQIVQNEPPEKREALKKLREPEDTGGDGRSTR